uniref:Protein kinase domain-containing protein n=1 Tax=Panagrolaimus sp. ES5 TaxID=591445 RepID=A0AC34GFH3_9BILA
MAKKGVPLDTVAFTNGTQSESQAMISERSENVEEQQIIVGSELPTSGIVNDNLLWDTRVALGAGGFGDVYKCLYRNNDKYLYVAVKVAKNDSPDAFNERECMARLKHP